MVDLPTDLLEGLDADEQVARSRLVEALLADGVSLADIRHAAAQERLVLLPLERALGATAAQYRLRDLSEETGFDVDTLQRMRATLGLPTVDPDEVCLGDADAGAFRHAARAVEAGVATDDILEINGVLASAMSDLAATLRRIAGVSLASSGDDEAEVAALLAFAVDGVMPNLFPVLEYALRMHLVQQVTGDYVEAQLVREGTVGQARPLSVGFLDLVGFTRLSEAADAREIGGMSQTLGEVAREAVAGGRGRLVKTIGDAVLLVAPTPDELQRIVEDVLSRAEAAGLPPLRAGLAHGDVLGRGGDVFGRPVNLASRLTSTADPGTVVCDRACADQLSARWHLAELEPAELQGIDEPCPRWRVRAPRGKSDDVTPP